MRRFFVVVALFIMSAVPAVLSPAPAEAASAYTLTANGIWRSNDGLFFGTWEAHFDVAGYDLSGTLNMIGLPGVGEANIHGSWDLNDIGFGILFLDRELATFDGAFEGDQFVGNFDTGDIQGIWSGALEKLSFTTQPINTIIDGQIPSLILSRSSGRLGEIVQLAAELRTFGSAISTIQNIISFDNVATPIMALANGTPDCQVNPAINKADTIFEFLPNGCSGSTCTQVRAIVKSLSNVQAIADGAQLYSCKIKIAQQATSGIYQLLSTAITAINTALEQLPINGIPGVVSVKKRFGDCHCSTVKDSGALPMASILAPLALLIVRRRSRSAQG